MTTDWRGTPIVPGSPVIYGAPYGSRSIQLVEGKVIGFTKAGRVNIEITRRAASKAYSGDKKVVHVGADRLVVINPDGLPPTDLPIWGDQIDASKAERDESERVRKSHDFPVPERKVDDPAKPWFYSYDYKPCTKCGCLAWGYGDDDRALRMCEQ